MNQQCKVCGEPAAGFHFGAFTCEGCKSFFGRSYNNLDSVSECKNNRECVINKKNRTSCKACRLQKCLQVGMSKSGSRYGRRSNWFKIHCLLQEQQQQAVLQRRQQQTPPPTLPMLSVLSQHSLDPRLHHQLNAVANAMSHHQGTLHHAMARPTTKGDLMMFGFDEYKNSTSPSISSPESHNSDSSVEVSDARFASKNRLFLNNKSGSSNDQQHTATSKDMFVPLPFASLASLAPVFQHAAPFLPTSGVFNRAEQPPYYFPTNNFMYQHSKVSPSLLKASNNNNRYTQNNNEPRPVDVYSKRFFLDAVLQSQRSPSNGSSNREEEDDDEETETEETLCPKPPPHVTLRDSSEMRKAVLTLPVPDHDGTVQDIPLDLSMKSCRLQGVKGEQEERSLSGCSADHNTTDTPPSVLVKDENSEDDMEYDASDAMTNERDPTQHRVTPMDLTTKI